MLDRLADRHEHLESLSRRQPMLIAKLRNRHALDEFQDKEGPAIGRRPRVQNFGDVGMIHQGQSLPLRLEAGQHFLRPHTRLDELYSDQPLHRRGLLRHPNRAHAPFANVF
jgi:hypothetical protein